MFKQTYIFESVPLEIEKHMFWIKYTIGGTSFFLVNITSKSGRSKSTVPGQILGEPPMIWPATRPKCGLQGRIPLGQLTFSLAQAFNLEDL